jgi:hypothetical protein
VDAHGNPIYGDVFGLAQVGRGWAFTVLSCVVGKWGKPPVDAHGNPIYGDVFGLAQVGRVMRVVSACSQPCCDRDAVLGGTISKTLWRGTGRQ